MEKYAVIIIGAGASGLLCALNSTGKTLLIEASDRVGKKILVTGNGKCNLTNDHLGVECYNTPLVAPYLQKFDQSQTRQYFAQLGIFTYADAAGRRYPLSNSAHTVLDLILRALAERKNVTTVVNTLPHKITKVADGFIVATPQQSYFARQLVLATGGNSGTNYLQQLGVAYHAFRPSLVGLKTAKNKGLGGVRVSQVRVKLPPFDEVGEILFKEDGISGIVIMNLSAYLARNNVNAGEFRIDLLANVPVTDLHAMLQDSVNRHPQYSMVEILSGLLHKSLARHLLEKLALEKNTARDMTPQAVANLVQLIKNFPVQFHGFADNYQVHTGGVVLTDLDENLQHKRVKNLFCIGEMVDVDGVCGGYNLQWAWSSGKIVGDHLAQLTSCR